jgi:hypothetical protein
LTAQIYSIWFNSHKLIWRFIYSLTTKCNNMFWLICLWTQIRRCVNIIYATVYNDIPYFYDLSGLSTEGWIENRPISFCLKQWMTILAYDPYQYDKFSYLATTKNLQNYIFHRKVLILHLHETIAYSYSSNFSSFYFKMLCSF